MNDCVICLKRPRMCLDSDVCEQCNEMLAAFNDDPNLMMKAHEYITKWRKIHGGDHA
jgi:hypothetical protein